MACDVVLEEISILLKVMLLYVGNTVAVNYVISSSKYCLVIVVCLRVNPFYFSLGA